jgi:branched-chain amino acid transport system ATP-binding protein
VVKDVSFEVEAGDIATIVGANGAGKTTTMRVLAGILPARGGRIRFDGEQIQPLSPRRRVERGLVMVPEGRRLFPSLTVRENLELGAFHGAAKRRRATTMIEVFEAFPRLRERERQRAGTLSGGEQQMLAIGRGLMSRPRMLMLDEPSLGLAPVVVEGIFEVIRRVNGDGVTVLLVEQNIRHALSISTRAWVLENGAITFSGTGAEVLADEHTRRAYLGV